MTLRRLAPIIPALFIAVWLFARWMAPGFAFPWLKAILAVGSILLFFTLYVILIAPLRDRYELGDKYIFIGDALWQQAAKFPLKKMNGFSIQANDPPGGTMLLLLHRSGRYRPLRVTLPQGELADVIIQRLSEGLPRFEESEQGAV